MSCLNYRSGNYSTGSLRNPCHIPFTSSNALCSTNVSCGDVLYLPSSFQDHICPLDNCQETCRDPTGCLPACEPSNHGTSCCPSTVYYVPRPCQGTSFLPAGSCISSSHLPVSCRPLSYVSSSCQPLSLFPSGCCPWACLPCGPQSPRVVSSSLVPLRPLFGGCQPQNHMFSTCRPSCSALGGQ
nr:keratin-associated protein 26-1-like [Manis javanica]